ncbi:MAG TPA: hypothetical protein VFL90_01720 [Methylomirabilota bacterium]|nr:hypothetical protein [Methylomirabilota bacterium]
MTHRPAVAGAAVAAVALGVLLVWGPWTTPPPPLVGFDGRPIPAAINDASAQARVHRYQLFLAVLAAASLAILLAPRVRPAPARRGASAWLERGAALALGAIALGALWRFSGPALVARTHIVLFAGFYGFYSVLSPRFYALAVALGAVALPLLARLAPRIPARTWWLLLTGYTLAVMLPGLLQPIVLAHAPPGMLQSIEWHYDAVLGGTHTLVAGSAERHVGYAYLLAVLTALIERYTGLVSFAADVRLVQAMNVAFALAALAACYAWDRARPLVALLALALVLPWVQNNHLNIFFPNQSGLRFLFFPLTIVALRLSHRVPVARAALAGGVFAALALLWNLETGLALTAGIAVHLGARGERLSPAVLLPLALRFLAGLAGGGLVVGLVSGVGLGLWPLDLLRRLLQRTAVGYGYGYPLYVDLMALLLLGYAIWALLELVVARRAGRPDPSLVDRGALGVVMLVWAAYYVLQPHPWNVWSYLLPGGLLLADSLFTGARRLPLVPCVLAVTIAVPAAALGTAQTWWSLDRGSHLASVAALDAGRIGTVVSGVMVKAADATAIQARAAYLATVPADTVVVTGDSYLLPKLSGRVALFPHRDPAYSSTTRAQLAELAGAIRRRAPSVLLLDDPVTLDDLHRRYFERLAAELADSYRLDGVRSGWSVFTRAAR